MQKPQLRTLRAAMAAGAIVAMTLPATAYASGTACSEACQAPEIPLAVAFPAAGAVTFGLAMAYRSRDRIKNLLRK